ncbi:MAG: O-antigen ligase family protein, partial [Woeseiaceae bacterium]
MNGRQQTRVNAIEAAFPFLAVSIGLISLLVGAVTPDARLEVSGVALNPLFYLCLAVFAGCLACRKSDLQFVFLMLLPTTLMLLSLFWSLDAEYGLLKYVNLLTASFIAIVFFVGAIRLIGVEQLLRYLAVILLILLVGAVVYKLQFGFFRREVPYLLNGPIVFARLMGLGALAAFFSMRGTARILACLAFCLAVAWTGSKGPLLAIIGVLAWSIWKHSRGRGRFLFATSVITVGTVIGVLFAYAMIDLGSNRLFAIIDLLTWNRSAMGSDTSAGVRLLTYINTVDLIAEHPLGVGLGAWSQHVSENFGLDYPHNLFLEVLSESGVIAGAIALLPFVVALLVPGPPALRAIVLFFFLSQQVSG